MSFTLSHLTFMSLRMRNQPKNITAVLPSSPNHYLRQIGQGFVIKSYDLTYKQTDYNFIYIYQLQCPALPCSPWDNPRFPKKMSSPLAGYREHIYECLFLLYDSEIFLKFHSSQFCITISLLKSPPPSTLFCFRNEFYYCIIHHFFLISLPTVFAT